MPRLHFPPRRLGTVAALSIALAATGAFAQARVHAADDAAAPALATEPVADLGKSLQVGDIVFTRVGAYPFRKVAEATGTWTNHVGIVLDVSGREPVIGESHFPFSGSTKLSRFVARSAGGRVAVMRLPTRTVAMDHPAGASGTIWETPAGIETVSAVVALPSQPWPTRKWAV